MRSDEGTVALPYAPDVGRTHYDGCWKDRGHHNCAVLHIATLTAEVERVKGENATMREAASRIWPMTWNDKPMHEWDQGDIANYVAGFWRHQHATARADALREAATRLDMAAQSYDNDVDRDAQQVVLMCRNLVLTLVAA